MNKKGNLLAQAIIFLGLWLIASIVWTIWLDGIYLSTIPPQLAAGIKHCLDKVSREYIV